MTDSTAKIFAIGVLAAALAVAVLALMRQRRAAAIVNGALALLFLALETPSVVDYLSDSAAYVARYGAGAVGDVRLAAWGMALAALALLGSIAAWPARAVFLWIGWIANLPTVALVVYLAFWFRVF
jgi:hypothetical protein